MPLNIAPVWRYARETKERERKEKKKRKKEKKDKQAAAIVVELEAEGAMDADSMAVDEAPGAYCNVSHSAPAVLTLRARS